MRPRRSTSRSHVVWLTSAASAADNLCARAIDDETGEPVDECVPRLLVSVGSRMTSSCSPAVDGGWRSGRLIVAASSRARAFRIITSVDEARTVGTAGALGVTQRAGRQSDSRCSRRPLTRGRKVRLRENAVLSARDYPRLAKALDRLNIEAKTAATSSRVSGPDRAGARGADGERRVPDMLAEIRSRRRRGRSRRTAAPHRAQPRLRASPSTRRPATRPVRRNERRRCRKARQRACTSG